MAREEYWAIALIGIALLWLCVRFAYFVVRRHGGARFREMLHKERMTAMANNVTLPDSDSRQLLDGERGLAFSVGDKLSRVPASKTISLLGIVLLSLGFGLLLALYFSPVSEVNRFASLSSVPISLGVGLIIYALLLRRWPH